MNNIESRQEVELTVSEQRYREAEQRLFAECGVAVRESFLDATNPDRRVRLLELGEGPPLVMIHGGNSVAAGWAPLWARLAGFKIIAPDRPGCGLTHRQDYSHTPDFRGHAVEFVRHVLDGAGIDRASLVANSMGGYWALVFALAHPERVDKLVLLGEPAGATQRPTARHRLGATPVVNRLLFATVARPKPDTRMFQGLMARPERASAALIECAYAASRLPGAGLAWRSMLVRVAAPWRGIELTYALRPELRSLRRPVLFAWGDRDFAPVAAGRAVAREVPDARFEVVPDAGHLVWLDQPDRVAQLLHGFLLQP